jgi:hypothetical protein
MYNECNPALRSPRVGQNRPKKVGPGKRENARNSGNSGPRKMHR